MTTFIQFQMRRDTTANWTSANPVLGQGEFGLDTTLNRFKIGDGATAYNTLGYAPNTVFAGTGVPSAGLGVNGDIYFDKTVGAVQFYGPKAAGAWGSAVSLQGATGSTGAPGTPGATGPGVPVSPAGTTGQGLFKNSATALDDSWANTPVDGTTITITGNNVAGVPNNGLSRARLAQSPALTLMGNIAGVTANVADITRALLAQNGFVGFTGWIDVTLAALPVLTSNTAAQNVTAINAILAAAPAGSTIYFPGQTFTFNAAWTMPAGKMFTFQGQGPGLSGGYTLLQWTSNVAATWITLASSTFYYYFKNLTFVSVGVAQTAGAVIDMNGNATCNIIDCHFTGLSGGTMNDVLTGTNTGFGQSWNSSLITNCILNSFKGRGVFVDSAGASLVIANTIVQGAWGPSSGGIFTGSPGSGTQALAGVQANNCGALEINDCDILGNVNNLLLSPVVGQVNASCFVTNTYFDSSGGSCFKIAGAGATVRVRFDTCSFTTAGTNYSVPGSGFSAIENAGSFAFAAGGQSVAFTNCNILNTFATAGTTNGTLLAGTWADWYFTNNNVAGWTNGFNATPSGTNISMLKVGLGAVGASGGYGPNVTGFLVGAGAYKGLMIQGVNARNNTTPLTLGAVTVAAGEGDYFRIQGNGGINPKMGAALTPPVATPVSTTVYTNLTGFTAQVFFKALTTITAMSLNGVATAYTAGANGSGWVTVEPGGTFAYTFTGTGSWVWVGQ